MKIKKQQFSPFWHKEIYIGIPVILLWTVLLVIIAVK